MANWKKVVVSGSSPEFSNLQVDGLTASEVVIGGGSAGNLSTTAINGTGNIVATTAASGLVHSGSFSGSFEGSFSGDGTNLTGITAEWDGTMFVGNVSGLASAQITGSGAAPSLILSGSTGNDLVVENDAEIKGNTKLGNTPTDITQVTGSFNLSGSFDIDVTGDDSGYNLTIDGVSDPALTFQSKKGFGAPKISLLRNSGFPNAKSIEIGSGGDDGTIKLYKESESQPDVILNSHSLSVFGRSLLVGTRNTTIVSGYSGLIASGSSKIKGDLDVTGSINVGGNNEITIDPNSSNVIKVVNADNSGGEFLRFEKSNGLDMAIVGSAGAETYLKLFDNGGNSIYLSSKQATNSYHLPNFAIGSNSADSNNTLSVTGNIKTTTGITSSNLTNDNLLVAGTNGEIESSGITFDGSALDLGSSNITTTGNGTFGGDVTISGDLAVAGTASFTHASNLDVADKYILLNSGSTGTSDSGGIVIQGPGQDIGDLFGYRSGSAKSDTVQRWGIASGFDAKTSADFTPSAFMAAVVVGTENDPAVGGASYAQAGNMYIDTDAGYDGIWIYS